LYIEEGLNPRGYFKDGPEPEPLHFYHDNDTKEPVVDEKYEGFKFGVPKCLEKLFRDNKIIPSNIPSFLKDAIKVDYMKPEEVNLDVDIPLLFDLLHNKALENLKSFQKEVVEKGRDYLVALSELKPDNYIALYNLACAESLLNRVPEALKVLEAAIKSGYRNMEHMLSDTDFDNIRGTEGFMNLISLIDELGTGSFVEDDKCENCNEDICDDCTDDNCPCENVCNNELSNEPVVLEYDSSQYDDDTDTITNSNIQENSQITEPKTEPKTDNPSTLTDSFMDLRSKWSETIQKIKGFGFDVDDEVLSLLLEQSNGNVDDVINLLLQSSKTM